MNSSSTLKVLALNHNVLGHITYFESIKQLLRQSVPNIQLTVVNYTDHNRTLSLRLVNRLCWVRLPCSPSYDCDFRRLRGQFAEAYAASTYLTQVLKIHSPDVLWLHTQKMGLCCPEILNRIPTVVSIDNTTALEARELSFRPRYSYLPILALEQRCFNSAAHIFSLSDHARDSLVQDYLIKPDKVSTVHPAVPLNLFSDDGPIEASSASKPKILFVGNDFVRKGGEDLLSVFSSDLSDKAELDVVTNASLDFRPTESLRLHKGLSPLSTQIAALYKKANIFVLPTHYDCFPISFVEAISAGLPCIGSKVSGIPEVVRDQYNGILISPGDRAALCQALVKLIKEPELRRQFGANSKELSGREFDPVTICEKLASIFYKCAGNRA